MTSQATTSSTSRERVGRADRGFTARTAPSPPSVVAEPPQPITMRRAPASRAARSSWPTPVVSARTGSSPWGWGRRARPAAWDISTTAVGASASVAVRTPVPVPVVEHAPLRVDRVAEGAGDRGAGAGRPPSASSRPSPPSDMGTSSAVQPAVRAAFAMAAAASAADAVPRNLSGAATRCGTTGKLRDDRVGRAENGRGFVPGATSGRTRGLVRECLRGRTRGLVRECLRGESPGHFSVHMRRSTLHLRVYTASQDAQIHTKVGTSSAHTQPTGGTRGVRWET